MRLLGRGPDRRSSSSRTSRENAAAFDRMGGAAMLPELLVEDMRGLAEGRSDVAIGDLVGGGDIGVELAPHRRRGRLDRLAAVRIRREARRSRPRPAPPRPRRRSGCRRGRARPPRRHRTPRRRRARTTNSRSSGVPELEWRSIRRLARTGARSSSVSTAWTPGQRQRVARVDPRGSRMRMRAAHERRVQHAGKRDVVDEAALAGEQGAVLEARNARSDQSTHVLDRACVFAARAFVRLLRERLIRHRLGGFGDDILGRGISLRQQRVELGRAHRIDLEVEPLRLGEKIRIPRWCARTPRSAPPCDRRECRAGPRTAAPWPVRSGSI